MHNTPPENYKGDPAKDAPLGSDGREGGGSAKDVLLAIGFAFLFLFSLFFSHWIFVAYHNYLHEGLTR